MTKQIPRLLEKLYDYRQRVSADYNAIADYVPEVFDAISAAPGVNSYGSRPKVSVGSTELMTSDTTYRVSFEQNRTTNKDDNLWIEINSTDRDYGGVPPSFYFVWNSSDGSLKSFNFIYSYVRLNPKYSPDIFKQEEFPYDCVETAEININEPNEESGKYYLGFLDALISSVKDNL
ncbi:MAG: hypothetical protein HY831_02920 [Candidatus Aenigmarchaeota archaeon]|nr:hypothetical protein [Candidatus Aenigmarchaeota archaeon]